MYGGDEVGNLEQIQVSAVVRRGWGREYERDVDLSSLKRMKNNNVTKVVSRHTCCVRTL